jgi:hypothetical protein
MKQKYELRLLLILVISCLNSNDLFSQIYINGNINFSGTSSMFVNAEYGPDALVNFENGAELNFLGSTMIVNTGTEFTAPSNPTGKLIFASGAGVQTLIGGNDASIGGTQPSLINIEINNTSGVQLNTSNTRIIGNLLFTQGHLLLKTQNLELSSNSNISNANETKYVVTDGTGFLAKESIATSATFEFPVGRAVSDYTPASITPSASDNFFVQVKSYTESASNEIITNNDGINRTWNIYSTAGSGASISLQHNSSTSASSFDPADAFVTQYQGLQWISSVQQNQGVWQDGTNANGISGTGTVSGSTVRLRSYSSSATTPTANGAFFSKSSNILTPLPITLVDFNASPAKHLVSQLSWITSSEINNSHFIVETSKDGIVWKEIGVVKGAGHSYQIMHYNLLHPNAHLGVNLYRLTMVDFDGNYTLSDVKTVEFNHAIHQTVQVFPNPSQGIIQIQTENAKISYILTSLDGKVIMHSNDKRSGLQLLDISHLENAMYLLNIVSNNQTTTYKIVLNK